MDGDKLTVAADKAKAKSQLTNSRVLFNYVLADVTNVNVRKNTQFSSRFATINRFNRETLKMRKKEPIWSQFQMVQYLRTRGWLQTEKLWFGTI